MRVMCHTLLALIVLLVLSPAVGSAQGMTGGVDDILEVESGGSVVRTEPVASPEDPTEEDSPEAHEKDPFAFLQGVWHVTYVGAAGKGHGAGYVEQGEDMVRPMFIFPQENSAETGLWNVHCLSGFRGCGGLHIDPNGRLSMEHEVFFLGHWGGTSSFSIVGPDELRGRWEDADGREEPEGVVVWRRVPSTISRVEWVGGAGEPVVLYTAGQGDDGDLGEGLPRVLATWDSFWWSSEVNAQGNRPRFAFRVYGDNLWGLNSVRVEPPPDPDNLLHSGLDPAIRGLMPAEGQPPLAHVLGFDVITWAWAGTKPGPKVLYFNDIPVPFELVIHGHPDNRLVPELTVERAVFNSEGQTTIEELGGDKLGATTPVRVRLNYRDAPSPPPTEMGVTWTLGNDFVPVSSTEDPTVFYSEWRLIERLSTSLYRELPGFPSSSSSAQNTADLFNGTWMVAHEKDGAVAECGVAQVAEDGTRIDLSLLVDGEARQYRSFEILTTKDSEGGRHTLDARFERTDDVGETAIPPTGGRSLAAPEAGPLRMLFVADEEESLLFQVDKATEQVALKPTAEFPERIRVGLWIKTPETHLSGTWNRELPNGNLGDGGREAWVQGEPLPDIGLSDIASPPPEPERPKPTLVMTATDGTPLDQIALGTPFVVTFRHQYGAGNIGQATWVTISNPREEGEVTSIALTRDPTRDDGRVKAYTNDAASVEGESNKTNIDYEGTIQGLTHQNGGALILTHGEPGDDDYATASLFVWDDWYEQAINKMSDALDHVTNVLIGEQKVLDALRTDPDVAQDPNRISDLDRWQRAIDDRRYTVGEARRVLSNSNYMPIQKFRFAKYYLDALTAQGPEGSEVASGFDVDIRLFDLNGIQRQIEGQLSQGLTDVYQQYVLGYYHVLSHLILAAPIYTMVTGEDEFGHEGASRGMAIVELATFYLLIKLPRIITEWGGSGFAWRHRPGFAMPSSRAAPPRSTLPPRWGHHGRATVSEAYRGPNIADDAWVHFGSSTIRSSVSQGGVIGHGNRSYWLRWGEVKNMTQGELRWKIGESAVSATTDLRLMVQAPRGAAMREVPGNYGFRAEGVVEGAVRGGTIFEVPRGRLSVETAGGRLPYPTARANRGVSTETISYWRGRELRNLAPGGDRTARIASADQQIQSMDANVAVARSRGVSATVVDRVLMDARSRPNTAEAVRHVANTLEIEAAVVNGERILVAADEMALFGEFATTPRLRSTTSVFNHTVVSSVNAKAALELQGRTQRWEPAELNVVDWIRHHVRQGENVGNWKRVNVLTDYRGLDKVFGEGALEAVLALDRPAVCVVQPSSSARQAPLPGRTTAGQSGQLPDSGIETQVGQ